MKKEMKEFVKKQETAINVAILAGVGVLGGVVGYRIYGKVKVGNNVIVTNDQINRVLLDIANKPKTQVSLFTGISNHALTPDVLGELGEAIKDTEKVKGLSNTSYTHFIAIGSVNKE